MLRLVVLAILSSSRDSHALDRNGYLLRSRYAEMLTPYSQSYFLNNLSIDWYLNPYVQQPIIDPGGYLGRRGSRLVQPPHVPKNVR
jgi:hypothetical protein